MDPHHFQIRQAQDSDWASIWDILEPVFRAGDTYAVDPGVSESEARKQWMMLPESTFVAMQPTGKIRGTYYLKTNHPGPGQHVCNCGYVVPESARGQGVASGMCEHSLKQALIQGFQAMQFNLVASTNEGALRLWKRQGFEIVGTLPGAFKHPLRGPVDAFVMYKNL
ncbi:MAG: ribosomal protein S18 acetylase RimI-like enzyme [Candidatus Paceibacteria bacterium]|jgi:ribosomal protein S18 acetylase RimI-like enzyme